jgi:hypothetical protein
LVGVLEGFVDMVVGAEFVVAAAGAVVALGERLDRIVGKNCLKPQHYS